MQVLVLGATGYVGSRLVPHLLERGHDVVAASSSHPDPERFGWDPRVRAIRCDVTDADRRRGRAGRRRRGRLPRPLAQPHRLHRPRPPRRRGRARRPSRTATYAVSSTSPASSPTCRRTSSRPTSPRASRSSGCCSARRDGAVALRAGVRARCRVDVVRDHPPDRHAVPRAAGAGVDAELGAAGRGLRRAPRDHRGARGRHDERCRRRRRARRHRLPRPDARLLPRRRPDPAAGAGLRRARPRWWAWRPPWSPPRPSTRSPR